MAFFPSILHLGLTAWFIFGSINIAQSAEEINHDRHLQNSSELILNNGQQWQTDIPLRQGMENIRHDIEAILPRIHNDSLPSDQYTILAKNIREHIDYIFKNCKLSPEVDTQLHVILEKIINGTNAMDAKINPSSGAILIINALNTYGRYFSHPGWNPISH
ncbi:MAG: hypothetical protein H7832_12055 [Magnetococcus sp. DMHC-6]